MIRANDRAADVTVVILGGGRGNRLDPLTRDRAKPVVPIAGKFRLIDIPISNSINSGMERMFLLTQFNSISLHRHIARTYKFDLFSRGYVQILAAQQTQEGEKWFQGTADAVRQNVNIVQETLGDLVLILSGDHMYRMDYRYMLQDHLDSGADVTLSVLPCSESEIAGFGAVRVDPEGRVQEFREKPGTAEARAGMEVDQSLLAKYNVSAERPYLASMGIYIFSKSALADGLAGNQHDFGHHVIPRMVERGKVQAHLYGGYWRDIGTIRSFYDAHMDLVSTTPPFDFYDPSWPFYTHPRYLPGARVNNTSFQHSILSEGSSVEDSRVRDSIIGVRTSARGCEIERSLIMGVDPHPPAGSLQSPPLGIGEGSVIRNAIIDKNARIGRNVRIENLQGLSTAEGPGWVIREGLVVVPKNAEIPDGTVI